MKSLHHTTEYQSTNPPDPQGRECGDIFRVRKYAKFGVFYAKIVQMTPLRLQRESLRLQKFSVTNTVLSLPFSQQIQFTLIVNVVNLN